VLIPYFYGLIYWAFKAAPERCLLIPCLHDEPQAYFPTTVELLENCFVLFHVPEEMELASQILGTKINRYEIIGEGVTCPESLNGDYFKNKYRINDDYILYIGRKDKGKNLHVLIDYFIKYLESTKDKLKLVIVGQGDDSIVPPNPNIINLGMLDEQDKNNAYKGAFATCNLSENESFSLVIMESWLTSTPVIVSASCSVTKGHCKRSNAGLFVANQHEFTESLIFLRENEAIHEKMGMKGRDYVLNNYSWDLIIPKIMKIIKEKEIGLNENID
jgi:glycosyltransferase involved in cell wall biosynthesis